MSDSFAAKDQGAAGQGSGEPDKALATDGLTQEQIQAVLKRDQHAQEHIRRLEQEAAERKAREQEIADRLAQLEQELSKRATLEELLARKGGGNDKHDDSGGQTKALDVDSVVTKVLQSMEQKTQAERARANRVAAIEAAKSVYGDSYMQKVEATAKELGMSLKEVDDLAGKSPQAFARVFGLQTVADQQHRDGASQGGVNSSAVAKQNQNQAGALPSGKDLFRKETFDLIAQQLKKQRA